MQLLDEPFRAVVIVALGYVIAAGVLALAIARHNRVRH